MFACVPDRTRSGEGSAGQEEIPEKAKRQKETGSKAGEQSEQTRQHKEKNEFAGCYEGTGLGEEDSYLDFMCLFALIQRFMSSYDIFSFRLYLR